VLAYDNLSEQARKVFFVCLWCDGPMENNILASGIWYGT